MWIEAGPPDARIVAVGEAPGESEIGRGIPFAGASGAELDRMLSEAGLDRASIFCTNVCHERPPSYVARNGKVVHNDINQFFATATQARTLRLPEVHHRFPRQPVTDGVAHLQELLRRLRPNLILALGNTPLWALAGEMGITKWRGSVLDTPFGKVLPTFHPADILRQWTHRPIAVQDFRRARREASSKAVTEPAWNFTIAPTLAQVRDALAPLIERRAPVVADIETLGGHIDCIGFAWSRHDAICIPFFLADGSSYWSEADEVEVFTLVAQVLRRAPITFHHCMYDCQVIAARWGFMPRLVDDTMAMQHVAFPGLLGGRIDPVTGRVDKKGSSLSLAFIASMYCEHYRYWKDDGKTWDPTIHTAEQRWTYNCTDCVRTFECRDVLRGVLEQLRLTEQYRLEMRLFAPVFRMMFRGVRADVARMRTMRREIGTCESREKPHEPRTGQLGSVRDWLDAAVGCDFNPDSTPQMRALFYEDLRLPQHKNRSTGALTLDDNTLDIIKRRNPLLRPLVTQIQTYRTLDTIKGDVDTDVLSADARFRSAFNVTFVETMRLSSNETALGEGGNLQNIPRPPED